MTSHTRETLTQLVIQLPKSLHGIAKYWNSNKLCGTWRVQGRHQQRPPHTGCRGHEGMCRSSRLPCETTILQPAETEVMEPLEARQPSTFQGHQRPLGGRQLETPRNKGSWQDASYMVMIGKPSLSLQTCAELCSPLWAQTGTQAQGTLLPYSPPKSTHPWVSLQDGYSKANFVVTTSYFLKQWLSTLSDLLSLFFTTNTWQYPFKNSSELIRNSWMIKNSHHCELPSQTCP